jgi:hypothetical protein
MMKHCTNCGEPVVDTAKFCQKCGTKVLPPISLIPPAERDDDEDDLIYKGSFKKKKKMKRDLAVNDEKIPGIIHSNSSPSGIGSDFDIGFGTSFPGRVISSSSTAALEVKNGRAKATLEDRITTKEMKSRYGVDPKNIEKRVAEIWTVEQGLTPCRFPAPHHLIKLHPL